MRWTLVGVWFLALLSLALSEAPAERGDDRAGTNAGNASVEEQ